MGISILAWLSSLDSISGQYGGLWMITRPIWKCPCIKLYLFDRELLLTGRVPSFVKLKVLQSTPWLSSQLRNICVTEDHNILHNYVEITISTFRHSWLIKRFVTWASNTTFMTYQTVCNMSRNQDSGMERHIYQWTGGRTNTGCLEIRIVEWSDMSTS